MSVVLLYSFSFTANNPAGGYVAGDSVDIYYDTSDPTPSDSYSGLIVRKNGINITSGADIFTSFGSSAYLTQGAPQSVTCNGTTQIAFTNNQYSFPYGSKSVITNSASCGGVGGGGGYVCNLIINPNIAIIKPSSNTSSDGTITISGTSTYPIKYKLGYDFDYFTDYLSPSGGIPAQSSGVFSSLNPGAYRIFARDAQNCSANILVNLPVGTSYGVKYTINYLNLAGHRTKIDILQKGYAGASTFINYGDSSIVLELRGEGNLDKFMPMLASQATINLISETDLKFSELFTNDPTQYKINYYKDTSGGTSYTLQWSGFILPQVYSEDYLMPPYNVTVQATDGLPNLSKNAFLQDDGSKFIGQTKVITLLATALKKTNLSLSIRCGCNMFASTMTSASTDDPLDQAYVDVDTYYLMIDSPSWGDVVTAILKSFRARLQQGNGVWNILRPEEMITSFNYREFDADGNYTSHSSYDPITLLKAATQTNRLRWSDQDQNLELRPGFGKLRVKYNLGLKKNILRNGDFSVTSEYNPLFGAYSPVINLYGFQVVSPSYQLNTSIIYNTPNDINDVSLGLSAKIANITTPYGYVQSDNYMLSMGLGNSIKFSINIRIPHPFRYGIAVDGNGNTVVITTPVDIPYQKVRCRIFYGSKYLQNDGTWTNVPTDIIFYLTQFYQFVDFSIIANWPDSTYTTAKQFYVKVYHSYANDSDFTSSSQLKAKITNSSYGTKSNRGNYDASVNLFPSSGGSGGAGAIVAGDYWTVTVSGTINGVTVTGGIGVKLHCINSSPGQDSANWLIGELTLPVGTKTEVSGIFGGLAYYELQNNTSAESIPSIIRPNDYDSTNNPNQWILTKYTTSLVQNDDINMEINKISVEYLYNGSSPFDSIITEISGESNNILAIEDEIFHGSLESASISSIVSGLVPNVSVNTRLPLSGFNLLGQFPNNKTIFPNIINVILTQNIIAGDIIYAGYYRDSSGVGYTDWARNGVSEANHLHAIWLSTTIAQYKKSWKKITGSLYGDVFMPLVNVIKDLDNTIYLPISISYDDKYNKYNGEFLELIDSTTGSGVTQPFSGGFSQTAFGNGYNI